MKYTSKILLGLLSVGLVLGNASAAFAFVQNPPNVYTYEDGEGYWGAPEAGEAKEGETEVKYTIESAYYIVIPATMAFEEGATEVTGEVTLRAHPKLPSDANEIHVSPSSDTDYNLMNYVPLIDDAVPYTFGTVEDAAFGTDDDDVFFSGAQNPADAYFSFTANGTEESDLSQIVKATVAGVNAFAHSGEYLDTVIWTVTVPQPETPEPDQPENPKNPVEE
ncbi:MAG: hypothetical protein LBT80_00065 [Lactobacillaceae bacterium]|jgi:hypothetical protein|nr:hypothetical protein [Lactobacillaceae bacterium]